MNIAEVARKAGVSPATVSRVINHTAAVREETRQRVLQVIEENRYTPNIAAKNLSQQNTLNNIGIVIPDVDNPFFCFVLKGVTQEADRYGYHVLLFNTDEDPEREHRFLQTVREQNLKGIIMIPLSEEDEISLKYLKELEICGVPVVLVDRKIGNREFSGVFTDDEEDAYRAVEVLIQAGHRRIATIAGPQRSTSGRARFHGYKKAMESAGLEIPAGYAEYGEFKFQDSYHAANRLLDLKERPTAIFTANNFATLAALTGMAERGLVLGHDMSILGFDEIQEWMGYSLMLHSQVPLSLVERPVGQLAKEAMELLQRRIAEGDTGGAAVKKQIILGNQIVLRGSERLR